MPPQDKSQFDGENPVAGYTLFHGKDGQHYYLKGENLSDDDVTQKVTQIRAGASTASAKMPKGFEPITPGVDETQHPDNPIFKELARQDAIKARGATLQNKSITPMTNASSVLAEPVGIARQVAEQRVGGYLGKKAAPYVGLTPEEGEAIGGVTTGVAAEGARKVMNMPTPSIKLKDKFSIGPIEVNRNIPPPPKPPVDVEATAAQRTAQKIAQRASDEKAGIVRPRVEVEAARQAKEYEAQMNKEAGEHDAIRARYEKEQADQTKAEQALLKHRERIGKQRMTADAAQQKLYDDTQKAEAAAKTAEQKLQEARLTKNAKVIADNEAAVNKAHADRARLNEQWAEALNRRGETEKPLVEEEEKLREKAQAATAKANATKTEFGARMTKLKELRVARAEAEAQAGGPSSVSPDVWKELSPMDKARIIAKYHNTQARAKEVGMVHAARGSSGAQLSNDVIRTKVGLPPPPEP